MTEAGSNLNKVSGLHGLLAKALAAQSPRGLSAAAVGLEKAAASGEKDLTCLPAGGHLRQESSSLEVDGARAPNRDSPSRVLIQSTERPAVGRGGCARSQNRDPCIVRFAMVIARMIIHEVHKCTIPAFHWFAQCSLFSFVALRSQLMRTC